MWSKFISIQEAFSKEGCEVELRGWVYRERRKGPLAFIVLRDSSSIIQCVAGEKNLSKEEWQEVVDKVRIEASVYVRGKVVKEERAPSGFELQVSAIKIIGESENFPISKDLSREFIDDVRHLWVRSRKITAAMKIRSTVFQAIRDYFISQGFYEVQSPIIQSTQCEGGSTLFEVKYFGKKLFLAQTWQLHAEAMIFALEKVFCIAPSFRAEKSKTSRHLAEYWHAEMEAAWITFDELMDYGENLIKHIFKKVLEENKEELKILERDTSKLAPIVEKPFIRMSYDEALNTLEQKKNLKVQWGKDLRTLEEDELTSLYDVPVIVAKYPKQVKAFYMKEDDENPGLVLGYDLIAPEGHGEIIGASIREESLEKLKQMLKDQGENPEKYGFYLDTRRYGSVPHGGYGLGVERIVKWLCNLEHIKDAIPFPRTMARYYP